MRDTRWENIRNKKKKKRKNVRNLFRYITDRLITINRNSMPEVLNRVSFGFLGEPL